MNLHCSQCAAAGPLCTPSLSCQRSPPTWPGIQSLSCHVWLVLCTSTARDGWPFRTGVLTGWQMYCWSRDCPAGLQQVAAPARVSCFLYDVEAAPAPESQLMLTMWSPSLVWHRPSQLVQVATALQAHVCLLANLRWLPMSRVMVFCAIKPVAGGANAILWLLDCCKASMCMRYSW